jgi:hypothetical protein
VIKTCSQLVTFDDEVISGWELARPVDTYDKESIFDYINGAAELYFAYDFRCVAAAEYQNGETSIIIDLYDMADPEGAFGIYSLNRYEGANYVEIGNEGILTGNALDFWKGRYFCKVYAFDMDEKYQSDVVNFGSKLALNIEEAGSKPDILSQLPANGMMPRTAMFFIRKLGLDNIHYITEENVLNLGDKTKGAVAKYQLNGNVFQIFIVEYTSHKEAETAFQKYSTYLDEKGKTVAIEPEGYKKAKIFETNGKLDFVGFREQRLFGFWDVETLETAKSILEIIK